MFLAMTSGVLFTGNNCLIQYFKVDPLELLLVRSTFQVNGGGGSSNSMEMCPKNFACYLKPRYLNLY